MSLSVLASGGALSSSYNSRGSARLAELWQRNIGAGGAGPQATQEGVAYACRDLRRIPATPA